MHELLFGDDDHGIPSANAVHLSKLNWGLITADTCNSARLLSKMLAEKVEAASRAAKLRAVKDQIKMRTVGFGWKDLHHAYSENGVEFELDVLFKHLIDIVLPEQRKKRRIPSEPTMQLPSRKFTPQLGTRSSDLQ